jgi:hypothetical protein
MELLIRDYFSLMACSGQHWMASWVAASKSVGTSDPIASA